MQKLQKVQAESRRMVHFFCSVGAKDSK